ncbi:hypothetical protein RDI58_022084 [Solanum bulbocastanum]|uniref:Uncharacterized protein n=1 Tax=Solanum bulbocastanum TaxID=147425 RepID=A0AAN8T1E4_SOLBU
MEKSDHNGKDMEMQGRTVRVTHILREGNKLVNYLANLALGKENVNANYFQELEAQGKGIVNSDKLLEPYMRIRSCRS